MNEEQTQRLTRMGLSAAVICMTTLFLRLPVPMTAGYVHLGDGFILFTAAWLGFPAALAAALGSALADVLSGFSQYALVTFGIKGAMSLLAALFFRRKRLGWTIAGACAAQALMVGGYYLADTFFYGAAGAAGALLGNAVQGVFGAAMGVALIQLMRTGRFGRGIEG